jgi:hypothetical protein
MRVVVSDWEHGEMSGCRILHTVVHGLVLRLENAGMPCHRIGTQVTRGWSNMPEVAEAILTPYQYGKILPCDNLAYMRRDVIDGGVLSGSDCAVSNRLTLSIPAPDAQGVGGVQPRPVCGNSNK